MICILLVLQAVVSYRSVPKILGTINAHAPLGISWIPHFTSVINWTLRLGLGLLQEVRPISKQWIAIIDHSIDIGTKKAFVVLRVTIDALQNREKAIRLEDCECIGLTVSDRVTGESINNELDDIFGRSGNPCAIIKDRDSTLNRGVSLWKEKQETEIHVIDDIGHVVANALGRQFKDTEQYRTFSSLLAKGASRLRQTDMAFLIPPRLRSKGRFQGIGNLGKWAEKVLDRFTVRGRAKKNSRLERFRKAFPKLNALRPFIEKFAQTLAVTSDMMRLLKNEGLNRASHDRCAALITQLPKNSAVKKIMGQWLEKHLEIHQKLSIPSLPVSSDIIESLFGKFKHIMERSPQADMNRSVLLIPALCGQINGATIRQAFEQTSHARLKEWEKDNIPHTLRKSRQAFFAADESKKRENIL